MSDGEEEERHDYLSALVSADFEDDDEALEALVQLKEMEFGDIFDDRDTSIDSDESEGISISFSHSEDRNTLKLQTTSEGHVHISCNLYNEWIGDAHSILSKISNEIGQLHLQHALTVMHYDIQFDSLDFPIKEDSEYDVSGIRITETDANYIVQDIDLPGKTFVSRDRQLEKSENIEETPDLGPSDQEAIAEFIHQFD